MNWTKLIEELRSSGMTQMDIAKELGKSQAWVSSLAAGAFKDMKWSVGHRIVELYGARCQLPKKRKRRSMPGGLA